MRVYTIIAMIISMGTLQAQSSLSIGESAPIFKKVSSEGSTLELGDIDSELILLDFWAGWCKPCLATIKSTLIPIYSKYDRNQLEIIGISYDKSKEKWLKAINKFDVPWKHIYDADDNELLEKYHIDIIPTYYFINRKGEIVGEKILSSELEAFIRDYFDKQ